MKEQVFTLSAAQSPASDRAVSIRNMFPPSGGDPSFYWIGILFGKCSFRCQIGYEHDGGYSWLIVMGLFMAVGYMADKLARSENSEQMHYLGLAFL